jgi:hypothetical protein
VPTGELINGCLTTYARFRAPTAIGSSRRTSWNSIIATLL